MEDDDTKTTTMMRHKDGSDGATARCPFGDLYRLCKLCQRWPEHDGDTISVATGGDEGDNAILL